MIKINYPIFISIISSLTVIKIFISLYFGDVSIDMEWNIIYQNLVNYGEFSYHELYGTRLPTVYMPPLYPYFLYSFSFLGFDQLTTVKLILLSQCILSFFSLIIFFKILKNYFDEQKSYIISIIYFIFPLNFYASTQISSVSIQVFCFIFFIYFFLNLRTLRDYLFLGLFSSLSILVRGEFWLLFLILIIFRILINFKNFKYFLLTLAVTILMISPILLKNFKTFNQIVITKSFGYNLWRGNSDELNINGNFYNIDVLKDDFIKSDEDIKKFDLYVDNFFLKKAKENLTNNPYKYIKHYFNKFFAFSIFNYNSNYPNYYNPLVFIPEIIISVLAILGIIINIINKRDYEILIMILYYLALIPIFFVLPRYKLFILPLYFIFASQFLIYLSNIFSKKQ